MRKAVLSKTSVDSCPVRIDTAPFAFKQNTQSSGLAKRKWLTAVDQARFEICFTKWLPFITRHGLSSRFHRQTTQYTLTNYARDALIQGNLFAFQNLAKQKLLIKFFTITSKTKLCSNFLCQVLEDKSVAPDEPGPAGRLNSFRVQSQNPRTSVSECQNLNFGISES